MDFEIDKTDKELRKSLKTLLPLACFFNYKPDKNGRCYSKECLFNADSETHRLISNDGCIVYKILKYRN